MSGPWWKKSPGETIPDKITFICFLEIANCKLDRQNVEIMIKYLDLFHSWFLFFKNAYIYVHYFCQNGKKKNSKNIFTVKQDMQQIYINIKLYNVLYSYYKTNTIAVKFSMYSYMKKSMYPLLTVILMQMYHHIKWYWCQLIGSNVYF